MSSMSKSTIPAIKQVYALECYTVRLVWDDNTTSCVDLREWLNKSDSFAPVLADEKVWKSIRVGGWGGYIEWERCEMEVPSSTLCHLHLEQAERPYGEKSSKHGCNATSFP
jgi:hypothetical protein